MTKRESTYDESNMSSIFKWALQVNTGSDASNVDNNKAKHVIRSCSLLINLLCVLDYNFSNDDPKLLINKSTRDDPSDRLSNLNTWILQINDFIENNLKMILVCPLPDFHSIAYSLDTEEAMMAYEQCLLIILACYIVYPLRSTTASSSEQLSENSQSIYGSASSLAADSISKQTVRAKMQKDKPPGGSQSEDVLFDISSVIIPLPEPTDILYCFNDKFLECLKFIQHDRIVAHLALLEEKSNKKKKSKIYCDIAVDTDSDQINDQCRCTRVH